MHFLGGENDWLLTSLSHTIYFCIFFIVPTQNSPSAEDLKLSSGERWIAIASWEDLVHAVGVATVYAGYQPRVFYSENGWYAVVLGPSTATDIRGFRASHRGPSLSLLTPT